MRICVAVAVALASACTGTDPSPTTVVPTVSVAELDGRAKVALAPPGAFDAVGGRVQLNDPASDSDPGHEGDDAGDVCGKPLLVASGVSVWRRRLWTGEVSLTQTVHVTSSVPATSLLSTARQWARDCSAGTVDPDVTLARPQGVDEAFAYCEMHHDFQVLPWSCHAVFARGNLFVNVVAFGAGRDTAAAQLDAVVPTFAEFLVKA